MPSGSVRTCARSLGSECRTGAGTRRDKQTDTQINREEWRDRGMEGEVDDNASGLRAYHPA